MDGHRASPSSSSPDFASHFGIENIPFGIASSDVHASPQCVTRLGSDVVFLNDIATSSSSFADLPQDIFLQPTLNAFAALGRETHRRVREVLQNLLKDTSSLPDGCVEPLEKTRMHLPVSVGDFTDFSCSHHHVQNAAEAMTGKRSAPPAFFSLPVGYAGRSSSIVVGGTAIRRPNGQYWQDGRAAVQGTNTTVVYGPCKKMDYELELGAIVGKPVGRGDIVSAKDGAEHIFGFVLINDWSARDIQQLEMNPLGPLNGKNLGTSMSPWIVTYDALEPFRVSAQARQQPVAPYLDDPKSTAVALELQVEVQAQGEGGNVDGSSSITCRSRSEWMYWTLEQCLAHQSSAGCGLRPGDLLATGTISGSGDGEHGCLLEEMRQGTVPKRGYLQDGEVVRMTAFAGKGVGFGACVGQLLPALDVRQWQNTA